MFFYTKKKKKKGRKKNGKAKQTLDILNNLSFIRMKAAWNLKRLEIIS